MSICDNQTNSTIAATMTHQADQLADPAIYFQRPAARISFRV